MEFNEKVRLLAKERFFGIKKLVDFGNSYAVILPMNWVKLHGLEIDGEYYVTLRVEDSQLIFSPISEEEVEEITVKEKR